jgi:hypothetical protein
MPDRYNGALMLCRFARALVLRDEPAAAARLLAGWEAAFEEIGVDPGAENWIGEMNEPTRAAIAAALPKEAAAAEAAEGRKLSVDEAVEVAVRLLR